MRSRKILLAMMLALSSTTILAQDSVAFYDQCVREIQSLKEKWPTTQNWKGESELIPSYEVDKKVQMAMADEFMKTTLYQRAMQQAMLPVGKMHQTDNKVIQSRTIGSVVFTGQFHEDEYIINLSKDYSTKKWRLEFSYTHDGSYSTPPPLDNIDINIDGSELLAGNKVTNSFCVIANIARFKFGPLKTGVSVSDSSAEKSCESTNNDDLGRISSWDL